MRIEWWTMQNFSKNTWPDLKRRICIFQYIIMLQTPKSGSYWYKKEPMNRKIIVLTVFTFINFTYYNFKLNQLKFNRVLLDLKKE